MSAPAYRLSVREAAERLGVSVPHLYRLAARRELPHLRTTDRIVRRVVDGQPRSMRVSGRLKFAEADLEAWIAAHRVEAQPSPAARLAPASSATLPMPRVRRFA